MAAPITLAKRLLSILEYDRDNHLLRIDDYLHGRHDGPYIPENADAEYRLLAQRCISNWTPLLVGTPAQALYVDGYRRGSRTDENREVLGGNQAEVEWDHWQRSRLDSRQNPIMRGALAYGHSFTVTEKDDKDKVQTKGLSALKTAALFEDPANDDVPYAALTVAAWPRTETVNNNTTTIPGRAWLYTDKYKFPVTFNALGDMDSVRVASGTAHGSTECPVTRFTALVDLEGRTIGVIEPMIALQDRINQTVFDLLIAQTGAAFTVRTVSGMAPPLKRDPETGELILDADGQPIPIPINFNAKRIMFAEDSDVKFDSLPASPLNGFIESIDMSIRHLAAVSQTPPHHLLGQIANLSAEALLAAETALSRKIEEFRHSFGESWERVFRLASELEGDLESMEDFHGEVIWRDMEQRSLAQAADALGKLKEQLGIPAKGLWPRVPGVTQNEIAEWTRLAEEEDSEMMLAQALTRSTSTGFAPTLGPSTDVGVPAPETEEIPA